MTVLEDLVQRVESCRDRFEELREFL